MKIQANVKKSFFSLKYFYTYFFILFIYNFHKILYTDYCHRPGVSN